MTEIVERPVERRISWAAVFAGVFVALACQTALTLLGVGIGFAVLGGEAGLAGVGVGTGIWLLLSAIVSFYIGGWVAGRMAPYFRVADSVLHGVLTWSVATVAMVFLFTGGIIGLAGRAIVAAGQAAGEVGRAMPQIDTAPLQQGAEAAGVTLATLALFAFGGMALEALAAAFGGRQAGRRRSRETIPVRR